MIIGIASADHLEPKKSPDGKEKWGGAGWARLGQYVPHLRSAGHEVIVGTMWKRFDHLTVENEESTGVAPDVVIIQRIMHDGVDEAIRMAQSAGQIVINDVDDWYWGLDPSNRAFNASHPKLNKEENTAFYFKNVGASDLITVSTPYLADRLSERYGNKTVLLRNHIDVGRFTPVEQSPDKVTIGWAGSTMHRSRDLEELKGILSQVVRDDTFRVHHSGHHPNAPLFSEGVGIDTELVTTSLLTTTEDYPSLLNFDIGIVPLRDTPFNHAKSDIKGLEYAASGIPFVASKSDSYERLMQEWGYGFTLAKKPDQWIKGLRALKDYSLRLEYQQYLLDRVWERDISVGAREFVSLLESLR